MTNLSYEEIERLFQREVRMCSGLGYERMHEIVDEYFHQEYKLWEKGEEKEFLRRYDEGATAPSRPR